MCDVERAIMIEDRLRALEAFVATYVAHDLIDHAHVHDGYVTLNRLREEVDACLTAAAMELEATEEPAEEESDGGSEEEPVATKEEPSEEKKDEPGPTTQGAPERRHALHHRIGGRR